MLPQHTLINGQLSKKYKEALVAFSPLNPELLSLKQWKKPIVHAEKSFRDDIFKYFEWQKTFLGHKKPEAFTEYVPISCLVSDENYIFTAASDKLIKVWEIGTGALMFSFHGHLGKVFSIIPNGDVIVSACSKKVIVWHLFSGNILTELTDKNSLHLSLHKLANQEFLVCQKSGHVTHYNLEDENFAQSAWECDQISSTSMTSDFNYLFTVSNSRVKVWDVHSCSLACEYLIKTEISSIKTSTQEDLFCTVSDYVEIWRFSDIEIHRYWETLNSPLKKSIVNIKAVGHVEWCGKYVFIGSDESEGKYFIHLLGVKHREQAEVPARVLVASSLESENVIASGDCIGNVCIWTVPRLEKMWAYREYGDLCLLQGVDLPITHLVWSGIALVSGSKKGSHTFYGLGGREQFITSPIQQFYSLDYLSDFTHKLTLCDFKLMPYKYQPEVPMIYKLRGFSNIPSPFPQLYSYFKHQESCINTASRLYEEVILTSEEELGLDDDESESSMLKDSEDINSVQSILEVKNDLNCRRCREIMLENTIWCNECGKVFHKDCYEAWKTVTEVEACLLCFKESHVGKEIRSNQRSGILPLPNNEELPQVGDDVVFIFQAYEEYLKIHPGVPMFDIEIFEYTRPTVMRVVNIEYVWPVQGSLLPVAPHVCSKVFLEVVGENKTLAIFCVNQGEKFLILLSEYLQKLDYISKNQGSVYLSFKGEITEEIVSQVFPLESRFELSPYKSFQLSKGPVCFWELGDFEKPAITLTGPCILKKYSRSVIFLYHPNLKNYKTIIIVPMYLSLIEEKLASGFYRSLNAVFFDVEIMGKNTEEYFGKRSEEYREFLRIQDKIKDEIRKNVILPKKNPDVCKESLFYMYMPWNCEALVTRIPENRSGNRRKLRKLN